MSTEYERNGSTKGSEMRENRRSEGNGTTERTEVRKVRKGRVRRGKQRKK